MSDKEEKQLANALNQYVDSRVTYQDHLIAMVTSVDLDEQTGIATHDGIEINFRLSACIDEDKQGVTLYPAVDSYVLLAPIEGNETDCYVAMYSKVDQVELKLADHSITISKDGGIKIQSNQIEINSGKNGGVVNAKELEKQLKTLSQRVDAIYNAIQLALPMPNDGGANLKTTMLTALNAAPLPPDFSNIENPKFTH